MKYKKKAKDCRLVVKVKTSFGEIIDEKELDRFARSYMRGFLTPKEIKKNRVEYTGPVGISLYERLEKPITKRDFLFIIEHVVVAVQNLQANSLPLNNLIMNIQNVYINEVTKEVRFLYVPTFKRRDKSDVMEFVESIVYSAKPADEKDNDFVSRFVCFFRGMNSLNIAKVEEFVKTEDKSVVNIIRRQNASQSGFITDKQQIYYAHYEQKRDVGEDEEATGLLADDEDEATGLLADNE